MRPALLSVGCCLLLMPVSLGAQPPQPPLEGSPEEEDEPRGEEEPGGDALRPPDIAPLPPMDEPPAAAAPSTSGEAASSAVAPAATPVSSGDVLSEWAAPATTLTLHGYFRVRGELWDTFHLGRVPVTGSMVDPPFDRYRPASAGLVPAGGCGEEGAADSTTACDSESIAFSNMRLRLAPTLALSDDVRVHLQLDVFDNLVLGSTPDGTVVTESGGRFERVPRTPRVPLDSFSSTSTPPSAYRTSLSDAIAVRRAWAEVTNRGLGQLRFGRMPSHWGLGLLANGGEGIDQDYQSDVDRIMAITRIAGFYVVAAWDFPNEGFVQQNRLDPLALGFDVADEDDVDQYVFAVARRMDPETQRETLQLGRPVLNGGIYLVYRSQLLSSQAIADPFAERPPFDAMTIVRRDAEAFIPDVWMQLLWRGLRVELEAALVVGGIENVEVASYERSRYRVFQLGAALETEYRLFDDKLGLHLHAGFASGDEDVEGLTVTAGLPPQLTDDRTISTFRFHPAYRIDLILWRHVMQQVAGAYYVRPGISYDFIRNAFGQLLGMRADLVWSRASTPVQTWGNAADLGVELDATLYYRSEDGPDLLDGFYGQVQYGVLFPLQGLGYLEEGGRSVVVGGAPELKNAQILRLLLGVQY
ncbi:MAG: TIGR04551 family protein [Myxococcota bacterium]|nr:TIGR04551 family protein [Myxococcota bacterium]MDW8362323.1 TIGR04551 family protein [Myxococcales bacterium]